jgi:predicted ArsR family transcriptional regulator
MCAWKGTRPQSVQDRDTAILNHLKQHGAKTRNDLAQELDITPSLAYLSLDRLRKNGLAKRCFSEKSSYTLWTAEVEVPCE